MVFFRANGIANATTEQKDTAGPRWRAASVFTIFGPDGKRMFAFPRCPIRLSNRRTADRYGARQDRASPIHAFYHNQEQINGGRNNMFAAMSTVGGWVMGYFDGSQLRTWQWAREYTLADNFFMGAFGGSHLNHQWLICACAPRQDNAPEAMRARLDPNGKLTKRPDSPSAAEGAVRVFSELGGQVTPMDIP